MTCNSCACSSKPKNKTRAGPMRKTATGAAKRRKAMRDYRAGKITWARYQRISKSK